MSEIIVPLILPLREWHSFFIFPKVKSSCLFGTSFVILKEMDRDFINKIKNILINYPVTGVYLYGSKRNNSSYSKLSDLDVAVLLFPNISSKDYFSLRLKMSDHLGRALKKEKIDLVILNESPPLLTQAILTGGSLILNKNEDEIVHFRVKSLQKFDDAFFLRQTFYKYLNQRVYSNKLGENL